MVILRNASYLVFFLFFFTQSSLAQFQAKNKILKLRYQSIPLSQYNLSDEGRRSNGSSTSHQDILNNIKDYYSLYINLKDRSSIYVLDSTKKDIPKGVGVSLADKIEFTFKSSENKTFKNEWVLNQVFFSEGKVGDIEWELTNEQKTINGLKCFKAKAKEREWMLTAWYTKEIPVSNGPSIYQGLPGLVVWVEDFFRTTEIIEVSYSNNVEQFEKLYAKRNDIFNSKENIKHYEKEPLLIVKKSDAANQIYNMIHGKRF
ncbi:GLPGLI family protein [Flavivirga aquatica]|nr:GLPGLI family protein [Flavivirga aquatica]